MPLLSNVMSRKCNSRMYLFHVASKWSGALRNCSLLANFEKGLEFWEEKFTRQLSLKP